jgi:hypothetical protein
MDNRKPLCSYFVPPLVSVARPSPSSELQGLSEQNYPELERALHAEGQGLIDSYNELLDIQDLICERMIQKTAELCERLVAESDLSEEVLEVMLARIGEKGVNHIQSFDLADVCGYGQHEGAVEIPVELDSGILQDKKEAPSCTKRTGKSPIALIPMLGIPGKIVLPYGDPQLLPLFDLAEGDIHPSTASTSAAEREARISRMDNSFHERRLQLNDFPRVGDDAADAADAADNADAEDYSAPEIEIYLED